MGLTNAWTPLRYHPEQSALWRTSARFVAVAAGRGSGKTELARRRVVRFLNVRKPWPDPQYFYALPTREQAKRIAWKAIKRLVPVAWIKNINETELTIETVFGSTLNVFGMDRPQRAEGLQYDGGVIDESSDQKPTVFNMTFLPTLSHRDGWCWRIGVPKRFGPGATDFKEFFDKGLRGDDPESATFHWSSEDILTPAAIRWAKENLDQKDYAEQYGAAWLGVSGAVFHAYNEMLNECESVYDPAKPLLIGSDFNVDPMAWVIAQQPTPQTLDIIDEVWIRNTSTGATLDYLATKFANHKAGFEFYGDASGRARKTAANSAAQSDYLLIRNHPFFKSAPLFYPRSNPAVVDRFAATNAMLCNATGERRCRIHPRCKQLKADLKARSYKPGTREANDSGDIGHITDALGYVLHFKFPIRALREGTQGIYYNDR